MVLKTGRISWERTYESSRGKYRWVRKAFLKLAKYIYINQTLMLIDGKKYFLVIKIS